jgi:hypothetical protein
MASTPRSASAGKFLLEERPRQTSPADASTQCEVRHDATMAKREELKLPMPTTMISSFSHSAQIEAEVY